MVRSSRDWNSNISAIYAKLQELSRACVCHDICGCLFELLRPLEDSRNPHPRKQFSATEVRRSSITGMIVIGVPQILYQTCRWLKSILVDQNCQIGQQFKIHLRRHRDVGVVQVDKIHQYFKSFPVVIWETDLAMTRFSKF
jgi:hypothetical protein